MYLELVAELLRKAPEILKTCVLTFRDVPALAKVEYPISIYPMILASVDVNASVRCMRIVHQCHIAVMNAVQKSKLAREAANE